MSDPNNIYEISIFKDAMIDDNASIQVDAVRRLPALAAAIGIERTRNELLPYLLDAMDLMNDEILYNLAEQIEKFLPLVGGSDHSSIILPILVKLSYVDETLVRDRAVAAMKKICDNLNNEQCENSFYPLILDLVNNDWFTSKCSAADLFAICYKKMPEEKQVELRNIFRVLIQDESPMVRRAGENGLIDFIEVLNIDHIINEFIPIFDNLSNDEQDSVRVLSVDVGIAIANRIGDHQFDLLSLLKTFTKLTRDVSWRVRQRIAYNIHDIQKSASRKQLENRQEIYQMYESCVKDAESEVRGIAAKKLFKYSKYLQEDFEEHEDFERLFEEKLMPLIEYLITDENNEVRLGLSTNILSLSTILRDECFIKNILPLVLDALENEESMVFKENMLRNLNSLPTGVDISKSFKSISKVIRNLLENSRLHWRTRRNILIAFVHITKNSTQEFFDENLRIFYINLLNDSVYAIRRTASLILPLFVKQFDCNWALKSLTPIVYNLSTDYHYLIRYVAIFCLNELISPNLNLDSNNNQDPGRYLEDLKNFPPEKRTKSIIKMVKLNNILSEKLQEITVDLTTEYLRDEDLNIYAEDTLKTLKSSQTCGIFTISPIEDCSYIEKVLLLFIRDFLDILKTLLDDKMVNIQEHAKDCVKKIQNFVKSIQLEQEQFWIKVILQDTTDNLHQEIDKEIEEQLTKIPMIDELDLNLNEEVLPDLGKDIDDLEQNLNETTASNSEDISNVSEEF